MIIETRSDVVRLSGALHKNQWLTIKAAANLLLQQHPQGIIIDCADLDNISEDGAKTFLDALRDIEAAKARIVVANLPPNLLALFQTIPGLRSQMPVADSVEAARASLRLGNRPAAAPDSSDPTRRPTRLLVPLIEDLDLTYGAHLGARLARAAKAELRLTYFLEVPRTLPLNAPLHDEEQTAQQTLARAALYARQFNTPPGEHVERVRDATEGMVAAVKSQGIDLLVLAALQEPEGDERHDRFHALVDALLHRAPCEVVIGRQKMIG